VSVWSIPMPEVALTQELLDKLTLIAVLGWGVIAFVRGWIVPASVHQEALRSVDDWKARHDRIAAIAEMALRTKVGM